MYELTAVVGSSYTVSVVQTREWVLRQSKGAADLPWLGCRSHIDIPD